MATGDQPFSAPDSSHVGLWEWHVPSGSFTCNERWAQAVGTTVDALAPRFETRLERIHPDDRERSNRLIEQHFERKLPVYECELRMQHSDGRWVWLLERGSVNEWDHDGNPVRMTGTQLDISERKRMEEALRESQQALRTIFDNTHDAIFVHAVDGRIVDVNRKMLEMYGVTRQQALSASIARDFSTPDNPLDDLGGIWRRVLAGEAITFEWKAKRPNDGSGFDVEVALKRIVLNNDTVVVANVRDITARKANERVLSESEKSFRALVEHSLDGITRWDRAHRHVYVNPIVEQEYGIPAELVIGKTARELGFPRGLCDLWKHAIDEVFASGRVSRIQYEAPSGAWIDWMLMPEVDSAGQVETVITSARDITESKRAEAEKSKLEAQLRQSQKLEAVGRLAGGVAHDFNNMLSVILGTSELALLSLPREAASRKHFENIRAAAERSASLTQQLLAFARKQTISPRVLNLNEAIEGMLK
ncbi:MAG: PAS domain S-box protein, partial [Myxococcota bacterium]